MRDIFELKVHDTLEKEGEQNHRQHAKAQVGLNVFINLSVSLNNCESWSAKTMTWKLTLKFLLKTTVLKTLDLHV